MPRVVLRTLNASIWDQAHRADEAATVPFRSIKMGEKDNENDNSINSLHLALERIERLSFQLPIKHRPETKKNLVRNWGPFHIKFSKNPIKKGQGKNLAQDFTVN